TVPLSGDNMGLGFTIDGRPADPGNKLSATYFAVSPDYFAAMGIRLLNGRTFTDRDSETAPNVLIVSDTFVRKHFPGEDPIGRRITLGYNSTGPREIVGVVGDVKQEQLSAASRRAQPGGGSGTSHGRDRACDRPRRRGGGEPRAREPALRRRTERSGDVCRRQRRARGHPRRGGVFTGTARDAPRPAGRSQNRISQC